MSDRFVEVLRVRGNGQVTLPAALRRAAGIHEGDALTVHVGDDGTITLKPVVLLDRLEADLLLRLQLRDTQAIAGDDLRSRAQKLPQIQGPVSAQDRLERLVALLQERLIGEREFIGHAITLGLPTSAITTILSAYASNGSDGETSPFPLDTVSSEQGATGMRTVRISQAFESLLYLPLHIADQAGFFAEQGIEVEITTAGGGAESWSMVLAGAADYSIHDPVFAVSSMEKGVRDAVVVASVCNGQAIVAAARDLSIRPTDDPREFITRTLAGRTVVTQPAPDSQWAVLQYLGFLYGAEMGRDYHNVQVSIGTELDPVIAGTADIGTSFPPQVEVHLAHGLHEVFDFSRFFDPYLLSALCTTRSFIAAQPQVHQAVINAFEQACQYAYAFPEEAVAIAQREFPLEDPAVIAAATRRCIRRFFVPQHAYVDGEAWRRSQILNKFVGTLTRYHDLMEAVNNEAALHAYRTFGSLRNAWDGPRSMRTRMTAPPPGATSIEAPEAAR